MRKIIGKQHIKNILLILVFSLLIISITKDTIELFAVSSREQVKCVPIIMYHQVKDTRLGKDVISPLEFENDLKYLTDNNYNTITMTQLINYVYEDIELPDNPIILSFDDGYLSTYKYVYPLLQKYNMKIVLSIIGKSTDDFSKVIDNNLYAHLTWDHLKEMEQSELVEIQNHTYNLHKIKSGRCGCGQLYNETMYDYEDLIKEDVEKFEERIGLMDIALPNTFTYPYGKYNDNTEEILKKLGYKATLSCRYGINLIDKNPDSLYGLKRICRAHNNDISKLIKEGMETLKYIER